ncbi:MAG TPA: rhomboid family intramembrane serine protease [Acidimicrobiia bacterium]|nr:rhomboid family intramembrane serine protease [Acidimicrobiia bacterium]
MSVYRAVESLAVDTATCFHHRDRPTGRACTRCGRPACPDCLREATVGSHCFECVRAARPPAAQRMRQRAAGAGPVVTKTIVGLNVAVFLLTSLSPGGSLTGGGASRLTARLALAGPFVHDGEVYRLITSGFIHYGIVHILFNMVILYRFGEMLEPALGTVRLVCLYTASLLTGAFGALLLTPHALTGGASGAVFGLVAATAIGLHQRGVNVWQSGVGGLIVVNLVLTFVIPGISIGGHLGGLAGGFVVGAFMLRVPTTRRSVFDGAAVAGLVSALAVAGSLWAAGR